MEKMNRLDLQNISIRRKLTLIILAITSSALLLAGAAFVVNDFLTYRKEFVRQLSTQAEIIGNSSTAALMFNEPKPVEEIMTALRGDPSLISARVLDDSGKVLVQYVREDHKNNFTPSSFAEDGHSFENSQLILCHHILFNEQKLGAVCLQRDLRALWDRLFRNAGIVAGVLLAALCVAYVLSSKLQRVISEPILHLEQTANLVAREKNFSVRALKQSGGEIGRLIDGFNEMLSEIQARDAALQKEIHERKRAEVALGQSQERFSKAFQASSVVMAISTLGDGRFLDVNDAFLRLFGYGRGEIIGRTSLDLGLWAQREHRAKLLELIQARGSARDFEAQFRTKQGEIRHTLLSAERIELGRETCLLISVLDVTERRNLEAQLRQSQKMEAIGQLAAGVAHDFNNIMTIVQGHASLIISKPQLDEEMTDSLQQILFAADRATNLTRQLLTFSRKQIAQLWLLDLNDVIKQFTQMLGRTLGDHITLQCEYASDLPSLRGDIEMLGQMIMNLAVNARDAMPNGGQLTLSTSVARIDPASVSRNPEAQAGTSVCLTVTDTGCGMDAATLSRIFEPFFTTKEAGKGTGLGLATVYGLVHQHQGWVEVESEVGRGTAFKIYFPTESGAVESPTAATSTAAVRGGTEMIFVVEDEPAVRRLVGNLLRRQGYQVVEASSGVEALELWPAHAAEIDLLFTDIMMPKGMSGRELSARLLAEKPALKIIFTSGYSLEKADHDFVLREGVNFLSKPYPSRKLIQMVRECLDGRAEGGASER